MKMRLTIEQFPMDSLDFLKSELGRYIKCTVEQHDADIVIYCDADVVKCMEALVVADKFSFLKPTPS